MLTDRREKVCVHCGKTYTPDNNAQKYCTYECYRKKLTSDKRRMYKLEKDAKADVYKPCEICGKKFIVEGSRRKYCSKQCLKNSYKLLRKKPNYPKNTSGGPPQPCWSCQNCTAIKCQWIGALYPIPGWKADRVSRRTQDGGYEDSYRIISCPSYKKDEVRYEELSVQL